MAQLPLTSGRRRQAMSPFEALSKENGWYGRADNTRRGRTDSTGLGFICVGVDFAIIPPHSRATLSPSTEAEMDQELEDILLQRFPAERAMWEAIRHTLKDRSFQAFHMWLGDCPEGHELRPKRDGKRAPFDVSHFEWLPIGTPRRVDIALRAAGSSLQDQINELRKDVEYLRGLVEPLGG